MARASSVPQPEFFPRRRRQSSLLPGKLGTHLRRAERAVYLHFEMTLSDTQLTPGEFGILLLIFENEGLSQTELGKAVGLDRSSVVMLIDRFEQRLLVHRNLSPLDRRAHALYLTPQGTALIRGLLPKVVQHERAICARLTQKEQAQLIEFLSRIAM